MRSFEFKLYCSLSIDFVMKLKLLNKHWNLIQFICYLMELGKILWNGLYLQSIIDIIFWIHITLLIFTYIHIIKILISLISHMFCFNNFAIVCCKGYFRELNCTLYIFLPKPQPLTTQHPLLEPLTLTLLESKMTQAQWASYN